jgi:hypothetical protein
MTKKKRDCKKITEKGKNTVSKNISKNLSAFKNR